MTPFGRNLLAVSAALLLSACGLFGDDDEELEPAELIDFETKVPVKRLWSTKVGADAEFLRVALRPMGDGNRLYAASVNGNVVALDPGNGKQVWRTKLGISLAAGPGVGEGLVVVVAADGYVVALAVEDGSERWRAYVSGESLATPLVHEEYVVVQTVDNKLTALSVFDGTERWSIEQSTPALTMRGSTSPVQAGQSVITGFDNGRVVAVNLNTGDVEWDSMLSPPSGRSDLDRLSDIDGDIAVVGQDIYALPGPHCLARSRVRAGALDARGVHLRGRNGRLEQCLFDPGKWRTDCPEPPHWRGTLAPGCAAATGAYGTRVLHDDGGRRRP